MDGTEQALVRHGESLEELISSALWRTAAIDGELVKEIVLELPWKVVIVLKDGRRIEIEADYFSEIEMCRRGSWDCYYENVKLSTRVE